MQQIIVISAFSNTSGKQIFTKTFSPDVEVNMIENFHANNSRLVVNQDGDVLFTFDFNEKQVSVVQDFTEL